MAFTFALFRHKLLHFNTVAQCSRSLGSCAGLRVSQGLSQATPPTRPSFLPPNRHRRACRPHILKDSSHVLNGFCSRSLVTNINPKPAKSPGKQFNLAGVHVDEDARHIHLTWAGDSQVYLFPIAFLRDNCLCPACFEASSGGRLILMSDFNPDVKVKHATVVDEGELEVIWEDGHTSRYAADWLATRRYTPAARVERTKWYERKPKLWGAELIDNLPSDTFDNIMNDDHALYNWLTAMEEVGFFLIRDSPSKEGQLDKIGQRVAYLRLHNYGPINTVKAKKDPSNIAYTNAPIGLHTDLPFYDYVPGVQMLHCIEQAKVRGGDSLFCDGFEAARQLKEQYPEHYKTLTTVPCDFSDKGVDYIKYHLLNRKLVITLNEKQEVVLITYNNQTRDSFHYIPIEQVQPLYDALKQYDEILNDEKNKLPIKLKKGEIACFHNYRVMHGRKGFSVTGTMNRHLEAGYLDWDELRSRRRVLQEELGRAD